MWNSGRELNPGLQDFTFVPQNYNCSLLTSRLQRNCLSKLECNEYEDPPAVGQVVCLSVKWPACGHVTDRVWRTRTQLIVVGLISIGRGTRPLHTASSVHWQLQRKPDVRPTPSRPNGLKAMKDPFAGSGVISFINGSCLSGDEWRNQMMI